MFIEWQDDEIIVDVGNWTVEFSDEDIDIGFNEVTYIIQKYYMA